MITEWYVFIYDRWEGYWQDRKEILDFIQDNNIEGVVFLTGDVHASFINNLNPEGTANNPLRLQVNQPGPHAAVREV